MQIEKTGLNVAKIRTDFPILKRKIGERPLVYLDNAATSQKPRQVIEAISSFYKSSNANIHRAIHRLGEEATEAFESTRDKVTSFINAENREEIIFVRNTTEALNLVAYCWCRRLVEGDRIVLTEMEHHSNLVPWQVMAKERGCTLDFIRMNNDYELMESDYDAFLKSPTKLLAITQMSNVVGTINPIARIVRRAHENGITVVVDAAQSVPHMPVDVQDLDCDFLAFSAHKMLGPTGVGVLYGKREILESMPPFIYGGDMIREVHLREAKWNDLPWRYEAGTSNIADVVAFSAAIDYLSNLGMSNVREHEVDLTHYALSRLSEVSDLTIYGPTEVERRGGVISFNLGNVHPHDLASILDTQGIAIRSGHHCAQPLIERLEIAAASRASFYVYNTREEIDLLVDGLEKATEMFAI